MSGLDFFDLVIVASCVSVIDLTADVRGHWKEFADLEVLNTVHLDFSRILRSVVATGSSTDPVSVIREDCGKTVNNEPIHRLVTNVRERVH